MAGFEQPNKKRKRQRRSRVGGTGGGPSIDDDLNMGTEGMF